MNHEIRPVNGASAAIVDIDEYVELKVDAAERRVILTSIVEQKATIAELKVMAKCMLDGRYDRAAIAAQFNMKPDTVSTIASRVRRKKLEPLSREARIALIATELLAEGFTFRPDRQSTIPSNTSMLASNLPHDAQIDAAVKQSNSSTLASNSGHDDNEEQFDASIEPIPETHLPEPGTSTLEQNSSASQSSGWTQASNPAATTYSPTTANNKDTEVPYILGSEGSGVDSRAREGAFRLGPRQTRLLEVAAPILKDGVRWLQRFDEIEALIANGLDFELDVIPGVAEVTRRALDRIAAGQPRQKINTWRYFIGGIRDHAKDHAKERAPVSLQGSQAAKDDDAPTTPRPKTIDAQVAPVNDRSTQAQDLVLTRVLTGEVVEEVVDQRPLTIAELKSLSTHQPLIDGMRARHSGISEEATRAVIVELIGDVVQRNQTYGNRNPLPTAEIFALLVDSKCAKIYLNANKAGTWNKRPGFDMTDSEKRNAEMQAFIERLDRMKKPDQKQEAEDRQKNEERRVADLARKRSGCEILTSKEEQTLAFAEAAARRKKAQGEVLSPHEEGLLRAAEAEAARKEANRKAWEQRANTTPAKPEIPTLAAGFKAQIAARQKTELA